MCAHVLFLIPPALLQRFHEMFREGEIVDLLAGEHSGCAGTQVAFMKVGALAGQSEFTAGPPLDCFREGEQYFVQQKAPPCSGAGR